MGFFVSWLALVFLVFSACTTLIQVREPASLVSDGTAQESWREVLFQNVDEQGRVNFSALNSQPAKLESFVGYIAKVSPDTEPKKFKKAGAKLAFYINSYNALAMYGVLRSGLPPVHTGMTKSKLYEWNKFVVGGKQISLTEYKDKYIRPLDDERVHFVLNGMSSGDARLSRWPLIPDSVDVELDVRVREFFSDEKNLKVDAKAQTVTMPEIMKEYSADFLKKASSLIAYVNKYRLERIPEDYKVLFAPHDWTLNNATQGQ